MDNESQGAEQVELGNEIQFNKIEEDMTMQHERTVKKQHNPGKENKYHSQSSTVKRNIISG